MNISKIRSFMSTLSIFALLCFLGIITHAHIYEYVDLSIVWYIVYLGSVIVIVRKVQQGLIFEPLVIVPFSYLFLIVLGTILFHVFKKDNYPYNMSNLVGIGYASLFFGTYLSQNYSYTYRRTTVKIWKIISSPMKSRFAVYLMLLICLLAMVVLFSLGGIPLFAKDVNEAKIQIFSNRGYLGIFFLGLPIISLAILYDACIKHERKKLFCSHLVALIVVLMICLIGYRSKIVIFIAEYISLFLFFHKKAFSLKQVISFVLLLTLFLAVAGTYRRGGGINIRSIIQETGIVLVARPVIFDIIVHDWEQSKYYYGARYFFDLKKLLPGSQVGANVELKDEINIPFAKNMPDLSAVTPSIIGEAYMNFGPPGIFWVLLVLGWLLGYNYKYMTMHRSFKSTVFYLNVVLNMAASMQNSIGGALPPLVWQTIWILIIGVLYEKRVVLFETKGRLFNEVQRKS